jgi:hypothetical protein
MVLSGTNQQGEIVRGTWKPVNGEVREIAVKSTDAGKTWEPWFDIVFRRASEAVNKTSTAATADAKDDKQTVAALGTEYQEAVKHNDAATMDRILADDFILITSSGKTYDKAELLDEARSGRILYEHHEDTEKTVRRWGDTAIVTAKLWFCWRNLFDPFFQGYGHCATRSLPDRLANVCPYRQFMCAITQSHERTPKRVPIDFAPDLHQAAGSKELDRTRPDDIGPTPFWELFCNLAENLLSNFIFEPLFFL